MDSTAKQEIAKTDVEKIFSTLDRVTDTALFIREKAVPLNRGEEKEKKPMAEDRPDHPDTGQQIIDRLDGINSILIDAKQALERFV